MLWVLPPNSHQLGLIFAFFACACMLHAQVRVDTEDGRSITCTGTMDPRKLESKQVQLTGQWKKDPKYGMQLKVRGREGGYSTIHAMLYQR